MSEYTVITAVNQTLKTLLWSRMQPDGGIVPAILGDEAKISFEPITKLLKDSDADQPCLSLFLYHVTENSDMKNRPLERLDDHFLRYPPLSLNLFYLVTPLTSSGDNDHKLLGKTMQTLYDNAVVKGSALDSLLQNAAEELRIMMYPMSLEEISKLWGALSRPYHLSVSYEVKVIYINSLREAEGKQIQRKQIQYSQWKGGDQNQ
jgi:Pvc16 N-terminal domain